MARAGSEISETYEEAVRFLGTFLNYEKAHSPEGRESIANDIADYRAALRELGDPHLQYSVAHVAGSKGKGSTSSFMARIFRECGMKTGLLTSPHLMEWTERVSVNGEDITPAEYGRLVALLRRHLPDGADPPGPGAVTRLLQAVGLAEKKPRYRHFRNAHAYFGGVGFLYFAKEKVDAAVIEVGMGGRLDHTNVFDEPLQRAGAVLVTMVTAIAVEHRQMLGTEISSIAAHKAGIIRPHGVAVLGPQRDECYKDVAEAVEARRREINGPPVLDAHRGIVIVPGTESQSPRGIEAEFRLGDSVVDEWLRAMSSPDGGGAAELVSALRTGLRLRSPLPGRHQLDNMRTILGAVIAFGTKGLAIPLRAVVDGLANTRWPARFEVFSEDPLVIVDCCHEPLSIDTFCRTFKELYGDRRVIAVTGFLRDNDIPTMSRAAKAHLNFRHIVMCTPPLPIRQKKAKSAVELTRPIFQCEMTAIPDPVEAVMHAYSMLGPGDALLVYGDFYICGLARTRLPDLLKGSGKPAPR